MSDTNEAHAKKTDGIGWPWLLLHAAIILNFAVEIFYASYVLFVVLAPENGGGPLWARAAEVDMDLMMRRRLYATEAWIAIAGMSIYLAVTELGPRMWRHHMRQR